MSLNGKTAVITGAANGIGKATAELFLQAGANVVGVDLRKEAMAEMEAQYAGRFVAYAGDISTQAANEGMIDTAVSVFGDVDILINNAGVMDEMMTVEHMANDIWDRTLAINLTGPMYAMRYFVQVLRAAGKAGAVVSVSSVGGNAHPCICGAAYATSKAGLLQLTRHAAYEYGKEGFRFNAICVGAAPNTNIATTLKNPDMEGVKFSMQVNGSNVRIAEAAELGQAILFLAGDEAGYVNGAVLNVDGGWSCA